jgi:hypothetical protein
MKPEMVGGAPPTTSQVNKARAAADAIKAQQTTKTAPRGSGAQTLKGLVGEPPKPSTGYADLQKAIDKLGPSKPAPKPTKASVAPKTPAPAKPVAPPAAKPTGAARVTYGAGGAPKSSFKAFSQQATTQATTPGSTGSTAQAVQKVDTAARLRTPMGRMSRLGAGTMGALRKFGGPTTAAIEGGVEMMDPEKNPSLVRTGIKKGTQLATASKTAALGAKLGSVLGPKGALVGGLAGGIAGYTGAGGAFEKVAGQTPTEKALAAKANRQVQQIQKPQYGDTPEGSFDKRPLQTVIKDPKTGKETVGYLAKRTYKGQEYTGYKAGDTSNAARAASSSNWLERIGRTINPGAYEKSDAEAMKKRVAKIKKLQGLPEGRTPMKTYTQFVEQVRNTYQQSDTSKKTQSGTERVLRGMDTVAHLVSKGMGRTADFLGSATSGVVKGLTGGAVDLERIGYEGEKLINRAGRGLRDTEKRMGRNLSQTNIQLNPPGSGYPSNLRRGR